MLKFVLGCDYRPGYRPGYGYQPGYGYRPGYGYGNNGYYQPGYSYHDHHSCDYRCPCRNRSYGNYGNYGNYRNNQNCGYDNNTRHMDSTACCSLL